jgi:hypothetical protein
MGVRQILQLEGNVTVPGLPLLDVSANEIAVANIDGLAYWPGLYSWDVNGTDSGFLDRVTDEACMPAAAIVASSRIVAAGDGHPAYSIQSPDHNLVRASFAASESFTVAAVVGAECGFGSIGSGVGTSTWWLGSNGGKLRFAVGSVERLLYDTYTGPLLTANKFTAVVFIFDKAAGEIRVRVNGVQVDSMVNVALKTMSPRNELRFGGINSSGSSQQRNGNYRVAIAFSKVLAGTELAALEAMLAESIY